MSEKTLLPRDAIDTNKTLPQVELVIDLSSATSKGSLSVEKFSIVSDGQDIGNLLFARDIKGREAWLNGIKIDEEIIHEGESIRGKGFGTAAYLAAIERAHGNDETFRTHAWSQTEDAVRVWKRFIDAGIAEVIEPFVPYHKGNKHQVQMYSGHVRIQPPASQT